MARRTFDDLSPDEQRGWVESTYQQFVALGHSYAEEADPEWVEKDKLVAGRQDWERAHRTWLERWSGGWYGMPWRGHWSMFVNNYIGHRNMCTYVGGPKFYIPPRRGPWLRFLRWLQVVPPKSLTVKDVADIHMKKPWPS